MREATWGWRHLLRQTVGIGLALAVGLFFLPVLMIREEPLYQPVKRQQGGEPEIQEAEPVQPVGAKDRGRPVRLQMEDGSIQELAMAEYLWGVVAAEMPASFEQEALAAQTCAARTYVVDKQNTETKKHPGADICSQSTCCQAYVSREIVQARWGLDAGTYTEKLERAVAQTDGLGILYQGEPIQALFFSSAAGKTVDAVEVWGNAVDYLKSVDSPEGEEVPNHRSQMAWTARQVKDLVLGAYPGANLSGDPSGWFGPAVRNEGGTVIAVDVGGLTLTGGQVRSLFSLRSATFTVTWDGEQFLFDVTGYGHGVGMSQYGANAMAREGKTFVEILTWYYTGTTVEPLW